MNKHYIKYFSVLMILFILQSCCTKEYLIGDIQRSFSFVDAATNNDLIYGDNKLWDKDSILIKYSSADAYNKIGQYLYSKYQDSSVVINFDNHDTCFIKFPNNDVDTIFIKYDEKTTKSRGGACKIAYNIIKSIKYNTVDIDFNKQPIRIYKNL